MSWFTDFKLLFPNWKPSVEFVGSNETVIKGTTPDLSQIQSAVTDPPHWRQTPTQVIIHKAQQPGLTGDMGRLWHINNDRTAAVSDVQSWLPIDSDTPKGVKIQLLTSGGVATYAHYHGEKFWEGWAPLPKIVKRPASPGENDGDSTKESTS